MRRWRKPVPASLLVAVTYIRCDEGSSHPPGVYWNAEQLSAALHVAGEERAAAAILAWRDHIDPRAEFVMPKGLIAHADA